MAFETRGRRSDVHSGVSKRSSATTWMKVKATLSMAVGWQGGAGVWGRVGTTLEEAPHRRCLRDERSRAALVERVHGAPGAHRASLREGTSCPLHATPSACQTAGSSARGRAPASIGGSSLSSPVGVQGAVDGASVELAAVLNGSSGSRRCSAAARRRRPSRRSWHPGRSKGRRRKTRAVAVPTIACTNDWWRTRAGERRGPRRHVFYLGRVRALDERRERGLGRCRCHAATDASTALWYCGCSPARSRSRRGRLVASGRLRVRAAHG